MKGLEPLCSYTDWGSNLISLIMRLGKAQAFKPYFGSLTIYLPPNEKNGQVQFWKLCFDFSQTKGDCRTKQAQS